MDRIQAMGFDHVRLPIDYMVLETEEGEPKDEGYDLVYRVVDWAMARNLNIVLDLHKAYGYDFNFAGDAEQNNLFGNVALQDRFVALWQNIAKHFCGYSHVVFELLNEVVEKDNAEAWNKLIARTVAAIREIAPTTKIIYGGIQWNSATTLKYLEAPVDENIIFTFHSYEPLLFTHQKAHWMDNIDQNRTVTYPSTKEDYLEGCKTIGDQGETVVNYPGEAIDKGFIEDIMKEAIAVSKEKNVMVYCGEFGVIDQAPTEDTLRWVEDITGLFKKHHIGYALWTYKKMDFGLIDEHYDAVREGMVKALVSDAE